MQRQRSNTQTKYNSHNKYKQKQIEIQDQLQRLQTHQAPQIKIYNRNYYLRQAKQNLIRETHLKQILKLANRPKINSNSYQILIQKLQSNIKSKIDSTFLQKHKQLEETLDYEDFSEIVINLNHFEQANQIQLEHLISQLWLLLIQYDLQQNCLCRQKFTNILMILMDPHCLHPQQISKIVTECDLLQKIQQKKQQFLAQNQNLKQQTLTPVNIFKLWVKIRQQTNKYQKRQKHVMLKNSQYSFKPQIGQKSRIYAQKSLNKYLSSSHLQYEKKLRSVSQKQNELGKYLSDKCNMEIVQETKIPYHQILFKRKLEKEKNRKIDNFQQTQQQFYKKRTAPFQQIKKIVNNLYYKPEKKSNVNLNAIEQQESLQFCTFHPEITVYDSSQKYKTANVQVRSFQKEIARYQKARQQKRKLQQAYENLGKIKKNNLKSQKPSFIERDTPKLILQINISQNQIQRIKLKGDQNPKIVAKKFISKYGLQQQMQSVLEQLIQQNLQKL